MGRAAWTLVALVVGASVSEGCVCNRGGVPLQAGHDFGDVVAAVPDLLPYLALARATLEHRDRASVPQPPSSPGRRVFVGLWPAGGRGAGPVVATGIGPTLAEAVIAASVAVEGKAKDAPSSRIELDVATSVDGASVDTDMPSPMAAIGLGGILATRNDGVAGFVLPAEVVQRHFYDEKPTRLDHERIGQVLAERAGVPLDAVRSMRAYRFGVAAVVESTRHDAALAVTRGMVVRSAEVTPDALLDAVRRGADYLVRAENPQGRFVYLYHPIEDREEGAYGWLRHAGTTYALLEAYEETRSSVYLERAERALAFLSKRLVSEAASHGQYVMDTNDEEQQKVGGAGLALIAYAEDASVTGSLASIETMRSLARFIISRQYEDGRFRSNVDVAREREQKGVHGEKLKVEPIYYPGEGALGLLRLYAVDPQPSYLDAARRAADWIIRVRDANATDDDQEPDHWMSYVLYDLYRLTRDETYAAHAYAIARAIEKKQHRAANAPAADWIGTFYDGVTTPGATRLEAYDADIALSRLAGQPDGWLVAPAREVAASLLGQQFSAENDYWLARPARAEGGVRESLYVPDIRIDYVQHAMSAWLHLARLLRRSGEGPSDPVVDAAASGDSAVGAARSASAVSAPPPTSDETRPPARDGSKSAE